MNVAAPNNYRGPLCYDVKLIFKQLFREDSSTTEIRSLAGDQTFWKYMVFLRVFEDEKCGLAAFCSETFKNLQKVVYMPSSIKDSQNGERKPQSLPRIERQVDPWLKDSPDAHAALLALDWQARKGGANNTAVHDFLETFRGIHV